MRKIQLYSAAQGTVSCDFTKKETNMISFRSFGIAIVCCAASVAPVFGQLYAYNVTEPPYNAVGDGVADDAPAFRAAYLAASNNGGGTIYVPAGRYRFASQDPSYPAANACVVLGRPELPFVGPPNLNKHKGAAVKFQGDAAADVADDDIGGTIPVPGSIIIVEGLNNAAFTIAIRVGFGSGHAITFEDLKITRDTGGQDGLSTNASGIRFMAVNAGEVQWARNTRFENLVITNQYHGISSDGATAHGATPFMISISDCQITRNEGDGIHLGAWGEVTISASTIDQNFNGIVIEAHNDELALLPGQSPQPLGADSKMMHGTVKIDGVTVTRNWNNGLELRGFEDPEGQWGFLQDVHISDSQFDWNKLHGVLMVYATNVNIAACSFTGNGTQTNETNGGHGDSTDGHGLALTYCEGISIAGCTFKSNRRAGLINWRSDGLSMSGCTFITNNNLTDGTDYALQIVGGKDISIGNCVFRRTQEIGETTWGHQDYGILISADPDTITGPIGLAISGIVFSDDMNTMVNGWAPNLSNSFGYIEFIKPGNWAYNGSAVFNPPADPYCRVKILLPEDIAKLPYTDPP